MDLTGDLSKVSGVRQRRPGRTRYLKVLSLTQSSPRTRFRVSARLESAANVTDLFAYLSFDCVLVPCPSPNQETPHLTSMLIDYYSLALLLAIAVLSYLFGYLSVQGAMANANGISAQTITRKDADGPSGH